MSNGVSEAQVLDARDLSGSPVSSIPTLRLLIEMPEGLDLFRSVTRFRDNSRKALEHFLALLLLKGPFWQTACEIRPERLQAASTDEDAPISEAIERVGRMERRCVRGGAGHLEQLQFL